MSAQLRSERAFQSTGVVDMKLEVIVLPVTDVDRAKRFYAGLGWRLDADFTLRERLRIVQMTPRGSPCSLIFGEGVTAAEPGSTQGLLLVVDDIEAARAELVAHGADVSEVFHFDAGFIHTWGTEGRVPGPDPEHRSYRTYTSFSDPDGNRWLLQEIKTRLPGRLEPGPRDVEKLTALLQETEKHHGGYEPTAPKHHWSQWYAAYLVARENGKTPDEADKDAALHMQVTR
jgi:catechol 2,3-dioxygenase-like lactoylglutathione lyase family enzyme